jgi:hypothetical protein
MEPVKFEGWAPGVLANGRQPAQARLGEEEEYRLKPVGVRPPVRDRRPCQFVSSLIRRQPSLLVKVNGDEGKSANRPERDSIGGEDRPKPVGAPAQRETLRGPGTVFAY